MGRSLLSIPALLLIWFVLTPLRFRLLREGRKHLGQLVKGLSTLIAASFAAWACLSTGWADSYAALVFAALLVCALADVVLDYAFVPGGVLFFFGHVLYVAAFLLRASPQWWSAVILALVSVGLGAFIRRYRGKISLPMLPCVLMYGVALSALLAMAVTVAVRLPSLPAVLGALGAGLFIASDMTLCHSLLGDDRERVQVLCLRLYYTGQTLLALSAFAL